MSSRGCLVLALLAIASVAGADDRAADTPQGFALVELFTSEGCSSCPPADQLLARVTANAEKAGRALYTLAFHVDYWDSLGWKDPFSDPAFSRRQADYEDLLGVRGPYTPQMVVNGSDQFVGSDESQAEKAIEKFIARNASVSLALQASVEGRRVLVDWKVVGARAGAQLHLAWVQAKATSSPNRGENASQTLQHVNVVRAFRTVKLDRGFESRSDLTPPDLDGGSVIAFVQEPKTGAILAAASASISAPR